uniref:collagen alpha-1(XXI) chain-like n=1 Tax=Pristiophorus japonicus TaxID=55135 RepID=UPI00398E3ED2
MPIKDTDRLINALSIVVQDIKRLGIKLSAGMELIYRTIKKLFKLHRLQSKVVPSSVIELQYADDACVCTHSEVEHQTIVNTFTYKSTGLTLNIPTVLGPATPPLRVVWLTGYVLGPARTALTLRACLGRTDSLGCADLLLMPLTLRGVPILRARWACSAANLLPHPTSGCRTAMNDLVFIMDGSWSVGIDNFETAKTWLVNVTSGFDIGPAYTQVAVIQYSDTPRLEIPFGQFLTNKELIAGIESIKYLGGNTQTGHAIKFATETVFPSSQRTKTAKNKIAVVVTDGKSQDDVVDASVEARVDKIILFAVGVGSEITESELKMIGNKPSTTYVIFAEDYETIERIKEAMQQKICEESLCPTRIPVAARDEKGFELMLGFKIPQKAQEISGSLTTEAGFLLTSQTDVTENTRDIFPEGLPPSYVFVATLRLKSPTNKQKFDLWRILSKEGIIQAAVTIDGEQQAVYFTTTSLANEIQTVTFNGGKLEKLFDEDWHQLRILVLEMEVTCFLDDLQIQNRRLQQVIPIFINGKAQVAKHVKRETSVSIEIQKLRLYCDPQQSDRETACEIPSVDDERVSNIFMCLRHVHLTEWHLRKFVSAHQAHLDYLVFKDEKGIRENLVNQENQERMVCLGLKDHQDHKEYQDYLEKKFSASAVFCFGKRKTFWSYFAVTVEVMVVTGFRN